MTAPVSGLRSNISTKSEEEEAGQFRSEVETGLGKGLTRLKESRFPIEGQYMQTNLWSFFNSFGYFLSRLPPYYDDYGPPPPLPVPAPEILPPPDRNDCEIIVVSRVLT